MLARRTSRKRLYGRRATRAGRSEGTAAKAKDLFSGKVARENNRSGRRDALSSLGDSRKLPLRKIRKDDIMSYVVLKVQGTFKRQEIAGKAQWLSWLERRPVTAEARGSSPLWVGQEALLP